MLRALLLIAACWCTTLQGQDLYQIRDTEYEHNEKMRPALVAVTDADAGDAVTFTRSYFNSVHDIKFKGHYDLSAEEVVLEPVSLQEMDLFIFIEEVPVGSSIHMLGRYGYDIYIDSVAYKEAYEALRTIFKEYIDAALLSHYQNISEKAQKEVKKLQSRISKLQSRNKRLTKTISKNQKRIAKAYRKEDNAALAEAKANEYEIENKTAQQEIKANEAEIGRLDLELQQWYDQVVKFNALIERIDH